MPKKSRTFSPEFKAQVGLEALKGVEPVHTIRYGTGDSDDRNRNIQHGGVAVAYRSGTTLPYGRAH